MLVIEISRIVITEISIGNLFLIDIIADSERALKISIHWGDTENMERENEQEKVEAWWMGKRREEEEGLGVVKWELDRGSQ